MSNWRSQIIPVAASVATLVVLVGFFAAGFGVRGWWDQQRAPIAADLMEPGEMVVAEVSPDDDPFWGPEDAAVTVVEFADYQCPFCQAHATETLHQIREAYGDRIRYVFRDFPIPSLHPQAFAAAEASQCAADQGDFWGFHDRLFENQDAMDAPDLKEHAAVLGLDAVVFEECLESGKHRDEVQADLDDGIDYGVMGTPAFFINGRLIDGVVPFSVFERIIDEELAKADSR